METVYINHEELFGEYDLQAHEFIRAPDQAAQDLALYAFTERVRMSLPRSFKKRNERYGLNHTIAANQFHQVILADWGTYFTLSMETVDEHPLGEFHLPRVAKKFFDELSNFYEIKIRSTHHETRSLRLRS